MKIAVLLARIIMAAPLVLFSVLWFLDRAGFIEFPGPPGRPQAAVDFSAALLATGYMTHLVKLVELVTGILLLANRYVVAALIGFAPISLNILLYHLFLSPEIQFAGPGYLVFLLHIFLLYVYRRHWTGIFVQKAQL